MEKEENKIMTKKNPWLGLQSYPENETLYGRDDDIQELTQCVLGDKETLLYGKSGIGKSSILNAGVIPTSIRKGYLPVPVRLDHKNEEIYISQIRTEIAFQMAKRYGDTNAQGIVEVFKPKSEKGESIYEFFHRHKFLHPNGERIKLLIILDQFEEIFTLQDKESIKKQFFAEMADFLNDIMPEYLREEEEIVDSNEQKSIELNSEKDLDDIFGDIQLSYDKHTPRFITDNDIHIVFTIREDFLSEFEYYTAAIPALKHNRYGLRPLNEEQAAQIILRPIPGMVSTSVAKLIIEKVTNKTDFDIDGVPEIEVDSAVLSLYMNRLYDAKIGDTITTELVEEKGSGIIKQFYYSIIEKMDPQKVEFLEERLLNSQNRRENVTEYDILHYGHFTQKELNELCEGDKKILRKFYLSGDMRIEFIHDILCPVIQEHKEERIKQRQEEAERIKQEEEKRRFVAEEKAKREKIEREAKLEQERLKEEANRIKSRNRKRLYAVSAIILFLLFGIASYWWSFRLERAAYYAQFERVNGWPMGVGEPLSKTERNHLPLYYRLSHKGKKKYDTDVEVCSSNLRLPQMPRIFSLEVCENDSDAYAIKYLNLLSKIKSIHFEEGEGGKLIKEIVKDENDSVLYYVNYFYLDTEGQVWAQFISAKGQAMPVRKNGLDRIKFSWYITDKIDEWKKGRVTSMNFFDEEGVHQTGADSIYGYSMVYENNGQSTTLYAMDQYGLPHKAQYNAVTTTITGDVIEKRYEHAKSIPDCDREPAKGPNGFWREIKDKDTIFYYKLGENKTSATRYITRGDYGNISQMEMTGDFPLSQPAIVKYEYDKKIGYRTSEEKLNADNSPFYYNKDSIFMKKWEYDDNGEICLEEHYITPQRIVYSHHVEKNGNIVRDEIRDVKNTEHPIIVRIDSVGENYHSSSYYGIHTTCINYSPNIGATPYHRVTVEINESRRTTKYFYYDDAERKVLPQVITKDEYGRVLSFYCKNEELDKDLVKSYQITDKDGNIVKSMMYFYQNGQNIGRAVMGIDGTPVRCDKWEEEGFQYYKLFYNKDFDDKYSGVQAVDEWGHRSSIWDGSEYLYIDWFDFQNQFVKIYKNKYDLQSDSYCIGMAQILKKYKQITYLPDPELTDYEIPYIHVLSPKSKLYNNKDGLRDGDRIIELGKWKFGKSLNLLSQEWERVMKRGETAHIEFLRPIPNSHAYERKETDIKCTKDENKLIEYYVQKLTKDEKRFIINWIK